MLPTVKMLCKPQDALRTYLEIRLQEPQRQNRSDFRRMSRRKTESDSEDSGQVTSPREVTPITDVQLAHYSVKSPFPFLISLEAHKTQWGSAWEALS